MLGIGKLLSCWENISSMMTSLLLSPHSTLSARLSSIGSAALMTLSIQE